jgi:hypothetical protein
MSPDPEQPAVPDLEAIDHFFDNWCNLTWTEWIPFSATKQVFHRIPKEPGLYRIRPVGKEYLVYIGETKRALHQRLHNLRIELSKAEQMPWSDPHTEAPALWAWRDAERLAAESEPHPEIVSAIQKESADDQLQVPGGADNLEEEPPVEAFAYECSAAPLDASDSGRRGMESFLLYRYRQEYGESPLCSLGRFHPRYRRSTTKKEGMRGGRLAGGQKDNPAGGPSRLPLCPSGTPGDRDWMGLAWSAPATLDEEQLRNVPHSQGLYLLLDAGSKEVIFIGRADNCASQLSGQAGRAWEGKDPVFSYHTTGGPVLLHQLRELEIDLIGNYYEQFRKAPEFQFRGSSHGTRGPATE